MTKLIKSSSADKTPRSHVVLGITGHQSSFQPKLMVDSEPAQVPREQQLQPVPPLHGEPIKHPAPTVPFRGHKSTAHSPAQGWESQQNPRRQTKKKSTLAISAGESCRRIRPLLPAVKVGSGQVRARSSPFWLWGKSDLCPRSSPSTKWG